LHARKDYSRSTESDLSFLKINQGVNAIVPLITDDELHDFEVDDLIDQYKTFGFNIKRFPIKDQMRSSKKEMTELILWIKDQIMNEEKVLIHCVGGLGLSRMVAASLLK
jgi:protein-tyrosine phosphatase